MLKHSSKINHIGDFSFSSHFSISLTKYELAVVLYDLGVVANLCVTSVRLYL